MQLKWRVASKILFLASIFEDKGAKQWSFVWSGMLHKLKLSALFSEITNILSDKMTMYIHIRLIEVEINERATLWG